MGENQARLIRVKKHILHITGCLIGGGAETQMRTLCRMQLLHGYAVSILYLYEHPFTEETRQELMALGIHIIKLDLICADNIKTIFETTKRSNLIHAHLVHTEFWALLLSFLFRKKLILTRYLPQLTRQRRILLSYFSLTKASAVICISETVKNYLLSNFPQAQNKYHRIYLGLNRHDLIKKLNNTNIREKHKIGDQLIALIPARLVPQKGLMSLLDSIKKTQNQLGSWIFLFAGDGPQRHDLESFVNSNNLSRQVKFLGFTKNIYDYMHQADIIILPSVYEGFGLALLEAMCFEKPIITTRDPAIQELTEDAALTFNPNESDSFEKTLKQLEQPPLRSIYGKKSLHRTDLFSADKMFHQTEKLYQKILN